jgi:hypothetical protein
MMTFRSMFLHGFNDYTPPKVTRVRKFPARLEAQRVFLRTISMIFSKQIAHTTG